MKSLAPLLAAVAALAFTGCPANNSTAPEATPTPTPVEESTLQRVGREARELTDATVIATKEAAAKGSQAAGEAAKKAEPAMKEAGTAIKDAAGSAMESLEGAASAAKAKIHEATAPAPSATPTPTITPTPVVGS